MHAKSSKNDTYGLDFQNIINGGFYICVQPGGITDALTGIHIPGPKAVLDNNTYSRQVVKLVEIPEPVQLPHKKVVIEVNETSKQPKEVLRDFNNNDEQCVCELFMASLMCGQIRYVTPEEMEEKFPETWANREENLIWRDKSLDPDRSFQDMFEEAFNADDFAHASIAQAQEGIAQRNAILKK